MRGDYFPPFFIYRPKLDIFRIKMHRKVSGGF